MKKDNRMIIEKFYSDVVNKGDTNALQELLSSHFVDHYSAPNSAQGIEGFRQFLGMISSAFPDLQVTVEDLILEGDKVVARLSITGTQQGVLMGNIQPTGKQATWTGIDIFKIEQGKITDRWSLRDLLGIMRQIGVLK